MQLRRRQIAANVEITTTIFANTEPHVSESSSTHEGDYFVPLPGSDVWKLIEPPNTTPAGFPA
jgi:hypothetical protein